MNRRGLLGEGLTAPVILILTVLIMLVFAFLSAGAFKLVKPSSQISGATLDVRIPYTYNPLLASIPVLVYDTDTKTAEYRMIRPIDIYFLPQNQQVQPDSFVAGLSPLVNKDNSCLIFHGEVYQPSSDPRSFNAPGATYIKYSSGKTMKITGDDALKMYYYYQSHDLFQNVLVTRLDTNDTWNFIYYYGGCLNG